jgi:chitin-binding protein
MKNQLTRRSRAPRLLGCLLGCLSGYLSPLAFLVPGDAAAHGYIAQPPARNEMCKSRLNIAGACQAAARRGSSEAFYTPQGSRYQGAGHLDYRHRIPDGKLCSGGNPTYAALDMLTMPGQDWPTTRVVPNEDDEIDLTYRITAFHGTDHIKYYVTRQPYASSKVLRWADLEELCEIDTDKLSAADPLPHQRCRLPSAQSGRHLIYAAWPVSASHGTQETFVTCADVEIEGRNLPWKNIGDDVVASAGLDGGATATLRIFDNQARGIEVQRTRYTAPSPMQAAHWLGAIARIVNENEKSVVRLGVRDGAVISAPPGRLAYGVYAERASYSYALDLTSAAGGAGDGGSDNNSGGTGIGGDTQCAPEWLATAVYVKGARVRANGELYEARWWTQGENPRTVNGEDYSGEVWKRMGMSTCG